MSLGGPLILCYHGVSDSWHSELSIPARVLQRQLRGLLLRRYRPAPLEQTIASRAKLVHVTFDDAYRSVANALPALERLGVQATVFVCADYARDGRPLDVPELTAEIEANGAELATMTWNDLRDVADRGVRIGSHTLSHAHLTEVSDARLDMELRDSRTQIEDELGQPCPFLAYPYGEADERVAAAAERAGYSAAFGLTVDGGSGRYGNFLLPRVDLNPKDGLLRMTMKTSFVGEVARGIRMTRQRRSRAET